MSESHTADLATRARYREEGRQLERDRIVDLLETLRCPDNGVEHYCIDELGGYTVNDVIALVKGEAE